MNVNMCVVGHSLQILSGALALVAAAIWFVASQVKSPPDFSSESVTESGGLSSLIDKLLRSVAHQSRLNALAAFFAALAAVCSIPQAWMPTCWG
jgi:hypothetical protein